eukprot:Skav218928  [mRNA]  locus=scaffold678:25654:27015:+ [translate_table: standard]
MSVIILAGDEVVVMYDHYLGLEGFLEVSSGAFLEVQYVDNSKGNIFCVVIRSSHDTQDDPEVGWVQMRYVSPPQRVAGDLLVVRQGATQPECPCIQGDILEVMSTPDSQDRLWCQNQRDKTCIGWISVTKIRKRMSDSEARQWKREHWNRTEALDESLRQYRKVLEPVELSAFPKSPGIWQSYEVTLLPEEVVELLEQSGTWTKVMRLDSGVVGWVPTSSLGKQLERTEDTGSTPSAPSAPSAWQGEESAEASLENLPLASPASSPSPSPAKVVVWVSSFGIETLDVELAQRCQRLGGGARCRIPLGDMAAALRRHKVEADLILDARDFPDPNSWALSQLGHSGRHHQIVGGLVSHRNFWYWLKEVKGRFQKHVEKKSSSDITVAIYCKRGKHRSVAAAMILQHIFQSEGHDCKASHMSYQQWCCYVDCPVCCNPPEDMQNHLNQALEYWRGC